MAVSVKDLVYTVNGKNILNIGMLDIKPKTFTCIIGPNGAGKSTLIKSILGLIKADKSEIKIAGKTVGDYGRKELATMVSYVPQNSSVVNFTTEEYIMTGRYPYQTIFGGISNNDREIVDEIIEMTKLDEFRKRDISTLSGGERQRVMIATALAQQAEIVFLDEPTIFLDPKSSMEIHLLLQKIYQQGITVIMVTHDINQALLFGTNFIGIKKGKVLFNSGNIKQLLEENQFNILFDMKFQDVIHPSDNTIQLLSGFESI